METHFPEVAERQPELLAQHFTEAGLIEKAVGYWFKAAVRSREQICQCRGDLPLDERAGVAGEAGSFA